MVSMVSSRNITSLSSLVSYIVEVNQSVEVGFLSEGNYHAVQNELPTLVKPRIYKNVEEIYAALDNQTVFAGLVSWTPDTIHPINVFPSNQISVRSMLIKKGNSLFEKAIDAAIVTIVDQGKIEKMASNNPPYEALIVHSCKPSPTHFEWPTLSSLKLRNSTVYVGALGPYNWGKADGDYTKTPFRGFWPEYYVALSNVFHTQYNVSFQRKWYKSSGSLLDALKNGDVDTTEPYMMVGSAYGDLSRKSAFDLSCITSATQDKYFTKMHIPSPMLNPIIDFDSRTFVVTIICIGVLLSIALAGLFAIISREKQGRPVFGKALLSDYQHKKVNVVQDKIVPMV